MKHSSGQQEGLMEYIYKFENHLGEVDKTLPECEDCISKISQEISTVRCPIYDEKRLQKEDIRNSGSCIIFCTNKDIKSKNKFREKLSIFYDALEQSVKELSDTRSSERDDFKRYLHNLISLNAKSLYSVYSLIPQESFMIKNREDLLSEITTHLNENPNVSAKLILDLLKNENLKKSELSAYNKIFNKEEPDIFSCSAHKVVLLVLNIFWNDLKGKDIVVKMGSCYDYVDIDFDAMVAALTHIFLNVEKYILPGTKLDISFDNIDNSLSINFSMISLKINREESYKIFEKGYSGIEPTKLKRHGDGLGLWVVSELLNSIGGGIKIHPNIDPSKKTTRLGVKYEKNLIQLTFPLS